jgi:FkbM family methyltransferase
MLAGHRFLLTRMPTLYFHLRNLGRKVTGTRRRQRRLFAELVHRGDLVMDVGANIGEFTGAFRDLGARVVAVEPQPRLSAHLRARFRSDRLVTVVSTAVSDHEGEATLYTTTADALATLEATRANGGATGAGAELPWNGRITVPLRTLDTILAEHGVPTLVKIDVEGHEPGVVKGLTSARPSVFFEVNQPGVTAVLETLAARGYTEFYVRRGEQPEWVSREPMSAAQVAEYLDGHTGDHDCLALSPEATGDRRPAPAPAGS